MSQFYQNKRKMEKVFISYRSTNAEQLFQNGCPVLCYGSICDCSKAEHCPVATCKFKRVAIFANRQKYECKVVPPMFMLPPHTILRPMDFFGNLHFLSHMIFSSDIFVRFEIQEDSYWTSMELELWKMHSHELHENRYFNVWLDENGVTLFKEFSFNEIEFSHCGILPSPYYERLLYYTQPSNWHYHAWGRLSDCFINVCPNCGKITLYSTKALKQLINNRLQISCTHCNNASYEFHYVNEEKNIIRYTYHGDYHYSSLIVPELVNSILLKSKFEELSDMHLICMSYESFPENISMIKAGSIIYGGIKRLITDGGKLELRTFEKNDGIQNATALLLL